MILRKQYNTNYESYFQKMAFELAVKCDLMCEFLRRGFPMDTIGMDLKVHMQKGNLTYKKDFKTQINQYSPCRAQVQPHPALEEQ